MKLPFFKSVRYQLIFIVLVSILPALGIILYSGLVLKKEAIREAERDLLELMDHLAQEQQRVEESVRQLLMTVAQLPEVRNLNTAACDRLLGRLLIQNPVYANLFLANGKGTLVASALPYRTHSIADRKYFRDASITKDFSVGEYSIGEASGLPVIQFSYPLLDSQGRFKGVIAASIDVSHYGDVFGKAEMPPGSVLAVADSKGRRIFRYPTSDGLVGAKYPADRVTRMTEGPAEGTFTHFVSGEKRLVAYKRFSLRENTLPYLFISVGISERQALARARKLLYSNLGLLVIAFCLAVVVAILMGRAAIVRRLDALVDASHRLGAGDLASRSGLPHGPDEVGRLAGAFDEMADQLEENERLRRRAEDALQTQFQFLRNLTDTMPNPVFYRDAHGAYRGCNKAFLEYTGLTEEAIVGRTALEAHAGETADTYTRKDGDLFSRPGIETYDAVIRHSSGAFRDVIISKATYDDGSGAVGGLIGVMVDITDRKRAEALLMDSERQLRQIIDLVPHMIFVRDWEGRYLLVNRTLAEAYGKTVRDLEGEPYADFHPDGEELERMLGDDREVMEKGETKIVPEESYTDGSGAHRFVQTTRVPFSVPDKVRAVLGVAVDVTERKRADEQIKASLKEKEVLLKEIHHRVKNNLQVMSSLLSLQTQYLNDPDALAKFRVSMDRIKSMALIHDKLYRSGNLSRIYFPGYAEDLTHDLVNTYVTDRIIEMDLRLEPVSFDVDTAMPLGLIINELVSNSLKHAFPDTERGTILVALRKEQGSLTLTIADNGVGFPGDIDFAETQSLGMQLVVSLVEQLDGTITLTRDGGTEFTITFAAPQ